VHLVGVIKERFNKEKLNSVTHVVLVPLTRVWRLEVHRLRVLENKLRRVMYRSKGEKVRGY
jgi:hypothetical protein